MLDSEILHAVERGLFHIYTAHHAADGLELLTGVASGLHTAMPEDANRRNNPYASDTVLGRAAQALQDYRRACRFLRQPTRRR